MKTLLLLLALAIAGHAQAFTTATMGPVTMTATGATVTASVQDGQVISIQLASITGTAGVQIEGSLDGATWNALYLAKAGSATVSLTATANGIYVANMAGLRQVRAKALYVTSGVVRLVLGIGPGVVPSSGIAVTPTP